MTSSDGKYADFVEKFFDVQQRTGVEVMVLCPFHDDHSASMQVNLEKGLFICFSCNARGGPQQLFESQGVRWKEPEEDVQYLMERLRKIDTASHLPHTRTFPEDYLERFDLPLSYWLEDRCIGPLAQKLFQLGYSPVGNYATIPLRGMHGDLLGVIKRHFDPDASAKYRYPKGFDRASNLFASWLVERDPSIHEVVLTEGSLDAIKVWQAGFPAMAIYGSSMSLNQIRALRRLGINSITLFFDDDGAGRKATKGCAGSQISTRKGRERIVYRPDYDLRREFLVDVVRWPKEPLDNFKGDSEAHDPGDLSSDQIEMLLAGTTPLK